MKEKNSTMKLNNKKRGDKIKKEKISKKEKSKEVKKENSEEPSWYHYLIVSVVFLLLFVGLYYLIIYFHEPRAIILNQNITKIPVYNYTKIVDGKKYNFEFQTPIYDLKKSNMTDQVSKFTILNSKRIIFSFLNYSKSDNRFISTSSVKMMRMLKYYFNFNFNQDDFQMASNYSCANSTLDDKVLTFNPYMNKTGIFYNKTNGCIQIFSNSSRGVLRATDKFLWDLIQE